MTTPRQRLGFLQNAVTRLTSKSPQQPTDVVSARVLLVDDNEDFAETLASVLRHHGHIVEVCLDARHALGVLKDFHPTVILLDLAMPHINGLDLARSIRQVAGFQDIPLIAVTGYGMTEDKAFAVAAGFNHHLVKPVDPEKVLSLIDEVSRRP